MCQLLVAGSEPSELRRVNSSGITPLTAAIVNGAPVHIVRTIHLVTAGVLEDGDLEDQLALERQIFTNAAVHYAANAGRADAIDALFTDPTETELQFVKRFTKKNARENLKTESAVNSRNALRETPLYVACKRSNVEAARRLLKHNADPRIQV